MKKFALIASTLAMAASAFGQGAVFFYNRVGPADPFGSATRVVAPIHGVNPLAPNGRLHGNATTNGGSVDYTGVPTLTGTGFTAALYGAAGTISDPESPALGSGTPLASTPFRTTVTSGGFFPTAQSGIGIATPFAGPSTFIVRAWDNQGGAITTWAAAMAAGPTLAKGYSDLFALSVPLSPPNAPSDIFGLTSFNLTVVPEPGVIALGVLGLGALLLRRRK